VNISIFFIKKYNRSIQSRLPAIERFEVVQHHYCRSCLAVVVLLIIIKSRHRKKNRVWCVCVCVCAGDDGIAPDDIIIRVAAFIRFSCWSISWESVLYTRLERMRKVDGRHSKQVDMSQSVPFFISLLVSPSPSSLSWCRQKQKDPRSYCCATRYSMMMMSASMTKHTKTLLHQPQRLRLVSLVNYYYS
jgi:hypothetical protein